MKPQNYQKKSQSLAHRRNKDQLDKNFKNLQRNTLQKLSYFQAFIKNHRIPLSIALAWSALLILLHLSHASSLEQLEAQVKNYKALTNCVTQNMQLYEMPVNMRADMEQLVIARPLNESEFRFVDKAKHICRIPNSKYALISADSYKQEKLVIRNINDPYLKRVKQKKTNSLELVY